MKIYTTGGSTLKNSLVFVGFSALVVLLTSIFLFWYINDAKQTSKSAAKSEILELTEIAKESVETNLNSMDALLSKIVDRQYINQLFGENLSNDLSYHMLLGMKKHPQILAMFIADSNAVIKYTAFKDKSSINVKAGKEFDIWNLLEFHGAREDNTALGILPYDDNGDGKYNKFFISKRVDTISGDFAGVAVAVVDGNYMSHFLKRIIADKKISIGLLLNNKSLLFNNTGIEPDKTFIDILNNGRKGSRLPQEKYLNDDYKIFSFKELIDYPLTIISIMDEEEVFKEYYKERAIALFLYICFILFIVILTYFLIRLKTEIEHVKISENKAIIASQVKSEFIAKMSHEFRTPLNAIIGISDLMNKGYFGDLDEKQKNRLDDVHKCGNHLLELINDVIDYAKGESGKLSLNESQVDIGELIDRVLPIVGHRAMKGEVILKDLTEGKRPLPLLKIDNRKMRQILINILNNAIKFTPPEGEVSLDLKFIGEKGVEIVIKDTGVGMREEDIPKAFELFEQVNNSDQNEGSGLGLPISKMFIELHGGKIHIESVLGEGTIVTITLPKERVIDYEYHKRRWFV